MWWDQWLDALQRGLQLRLWTWYQLLQGTTNNLDSNNEIWISVPPIQNKNCKSCLQDLGVSPGNYCFGTGARSLGKQAAEHNSLEWHCGLTWNISYAVQIKIPCFTIQELCITFFVCKRLREFCVTAFQILSPVLVSSENAERGHLRENEERITLNTLLKTLNFREDFFLMTRASFERSWSV